MTQQSFLVADGTAGRWKITVNAYEVSTNIAANTSTIRYVAYLEKGPYGTGATGTIRNTWYVRLRDHNGNLIANRTGGAFTYSPDNGTYTLVATSDATLAHRPDGSASVTVECFAEGDIGPSSTVYSAGGSFAVTPIVDFDFSAGPPNGSIAAGTLKATYTAGTGVKLDWLASTSYKTPVTYYISYRSSTNGGVSYGSWSTPELTTTNLTYTVGTGSLVLGRTYQFRIRAYNTFDNYSGYVYPNTVFLASGGKRATGQPDPDAWALTTTAAKRYDPTASPQWQTLTTLKRYDGSTWANLS